MEHISRALVVDDNIDSAMCLRMLLQLKLGCSVRMAHDGPSAVDVAADFQPELVLLDLGLPRMNGYEVCQRLRCLPEGHQMVIIAVTGWSRLEDIDRSLESGFTHHLVKPIDIEALESLL